jgi:AraC-like DNA-binding protein
MPPHSARRFQWLVIWQNVISIILVFFIGLALRACLSRSAFIARFTELVGCPPMIILRDLRMRKAAQQLKANGFSIDQIAQNAGYGSRSSFVGAFRRAYGSDSSRTPQQTRTAHSRERLGSRQRAIGGELRCSGRGYDERWRSMGVGLSRRDHVALG